MHYIENQNIIAILRNDYLVYYGDVINVSGLYDGGDFCTKFNRNINVEPCKNVQSKNFSLAFGKPLLAVRAFFLVLYPPDAIIVI